MGGKGRYLVQRQEFYFSAVHLPETQGKEGLGDGTEQELSGDGFTMKILSSPGFGLGDLRQWGANDYLWAGYPVRSPAVKNAKAATELEGVIIDLK